MTDVVWINNFRGMKEAISIINFRELTEVVLIKNFMVYTMIYNDIVNLYNDIV